MTTEIARARAEREFEKYRIVQDRLFESDFDRVVAETKSPLRGHPEGHPSQEEAVIHMRDHLKRSSQASPRSP